jgi:hypothetical protein
MQPAGKLAQGKSFFLNYTHGVTYNTSTFTVLVLRNMEACSAVGVSTTMHDPADAAFTVHSNTVVLYFSAAAAA